MPYALTRIPITMATFASIEIPRGPNIKPPPEAPELPDSLEATVTIVVDDDISTGDLAPDGVEVMSFRSNVPEIAADDMGDHLYFQAP